MCHLGVNQLITVYHFSLLCQMDESTSRFRIPKTSDEEKTSIINSAPKSTVYKNEWAIQIFQESVDIWILYPNLHPVFIGYPNTCTWCGIQAVISSWLYELLMSLKSHYQASETNPTLHLCLRTCTPVKIHCPVPYLAYQNPCLHICRYLAKKHFLHFKLEDG